MTLPGDASRSRRAFDVFLKLLDVATPALDDALREECGDDLALREEVVALLDSDRSSVDVDAAADAARRDLLDALAPAETEFDGDGDRPVADFPSAELATDRPKYTILRELGRGGMGRVYLALDTDLGREVALKMVNTSSPRQLRRFLDEARVMARLDHPNIVPVYEVGLTRDRRPYFTMRVVRGDDLATRLRSHRGNHSAAWPLPERLVTFLHVCEAVRYAHDRGVIHRDLKPQNIMLDSDQQVLVMDWGLSKVSRDSSLATALSASLTGSGNLLGTPHYMAPEQARGERVDARADVYSLGVVLYELLTLTRPFEGTTTEILAAVLRDAPLPPARHAPETPRVLENLCLELLAKSPNARPASVDVVIAEVRAWLEESGVEQVRGTRRANDEGDSTTASGTCASIPARPRRLALPVPTELTLVGRSYELTVLTHRLAEAREGRGQIALIEGESGIGKTRLVAELLSRLDPADDTTVLYGAAPTGLARDGLAVFHDALAHHFEAGGHRSNAVLQLLDRSAGTLSLAARLIGREDSQAAPPSLDATQVFLAELLHLLTRSRPLIWILDDLHRAPAATHDLLAGLAATVCENPVFFVAIAERFPSSDSLADLVRNPIGVRLRLSRLSELDVQSLVVTHFGAAPAEAIGKTLYRRSDGNPLFLLEMLRRLEEVSDPQQVDSLPNSIRELMLSRLTKIDAEDRAVLDVAAVQGVAFDPDLVARVLERKRRAVLEALTGMERRGGLVRPTPSNFRFDHPQLAHVVADELPPALAVEYHRLTADALLEQRRAAILGPPDRVFLAEHYLRGGSPDEAAPHVLSALDHLASRYAHESVVELSRLALDVLPADRAALRCATCLREARCWDLRGEREAQSRALDSALREALAAGDTALELEARDAQGWLLASTGRLEEARAMLRAAAARAAALASASAEASCRNHLGSVLSELGDYEEAKSELERSIALSSAEGLSGQMANATGNLGIILLELHDYRAAKASFERQLEICRSLTDRRGESQALGNLGLTLSLLNDRDGAAAIYETQIQLCEAIGHRKAQAVTTGNLGALHYGRGDFGQAELCFARHRALARQVGDRLGEAVALVNLATVALDQGRLDEAALKVREATESAREIGARRVEADAIHCAAELARYRGDDATSRALHESALALRRDLQSADAVAESLAGLGRLALIAGDRRAVAEYIEDAGLTAGQPPRNDAEALLRAFAAVATGLPISVQVLDDSTSILTRVELLLLASNGEGAEAARAESRLLLERIEASIEPQHRAGFRRWNPIARPIATPPA